MSGIVKTKGLAQQRFMNSEVLMSKRDQIRLKKTKGEITVVSNVCLDHAHDGKRYTFLGQIGDGVSLTAKEHLSVVPQFLQTIETMGEKPKWYILIDDTLGIEKNYCEKLAGTKPEFHRRAKESKNAIQGMTGAEVCVETFSAFYQKYGIDYLPTQRRTTALIVGKVNNGEFSPQFQAYMKMHERMFAQSHQKRSPEEKIKAVAHSMSLMVTHGTLLRQVFLGKNLLVINHASPFHKHFFSHQLVSSNVDLTNQPKFMIGIINKNLY